MSRNRKSRVPAFFPCNCHVPRVFFTIRPGNRDERFIRPRNVGSLKECKIIAGFCACRDTFDRRIGIKLSNPLHSSLGHRLIGLGASMLIFLFIDVNNSIGIIILLNLIYRIKPTRFVLSFDSRFKLIPTFIIDHSLYVHSHVRYLYIYLLIHVFCTLLIFIL